jgi:3-phenylpropionate/cinnamic acid dioxygenase small subunit
MGVQELLDRMEIEDLPKRYAQGIDARDWEAVDACFWPDADVHGTTSQGKYPEYIANLRKSVEQFHTTMHFFGTQVSRVSGDTGHVTTYGIAFHLGERVDEFVVGVRYLDDVTRVGGRWKIANRKVEGVWRRVLNGEIDDVAAPPPR